MAQLYPPSFVFQDRFGNPLDGGGVFFSDTGTNDAKSIFTDAALSSAATNNTTVPKGQPLNSDGRFKQNAVYGSGTYRVTLFDSAGNQISLTDDFNRDANPDDGLDTQITIDQTLDIITFKVDTVAAAVKFGWQKVADTGFITSDPKAFSADATENTHRLAVLATNAITIPVGTTNLVSTGYFIEPNITNNGTLTNAATVYIKDAPTEATNNYSLWVDAGAVQFDGTLAVLGVSTFSGEIRADSDSARDVGTTSVRWANVYTDNIGDTGQDLTVLATTVNFPAASILAFNSDDILITASANTLTVSGGTWATAALTATTITGSGLLKVDDVTNATSTTAASLQTDGGIAWVLDAYVGDDMFFTSGAVLNFNAGNMTLTHSAGDLAIGGGSLTIAAGTGRFLVDSNTNTSSNIISITSADSLTTGNVARFQSNSSDTGTRSIVSIENDNSAATGATSLTVVQGSTADGIFINQDGNGKALNIDSESTSNPPIVTASVAVDTNFERHLKIGALTIWISDGTTAEGALTGVEGDICLNGGTGAGQTAYCNANGTNWTNM